MFAIDAVAEPNSTAPAPPVGGGTLRRFYAYRLLSEAQFASAIWIIFLRSRGFSLTEIGFAESAFHLAPVLLELPSGSFADLVGRRWSLALSGLLVASSSAVIYGAHGLPLVMLAMFLNGASFSFRSGADQAYLYEALGDRQHGFAGILGKLLGASYIVAAATAWLGASLSDVSYAWPYGLTIGVALGGIWLAVGLAEPPRQRHAEGVAASIRQHAREAWTLLRGRRDVTAMLLFSGPFWAASTIAFLYFQAAFADRGLSNGSIGLILGVVTVINAVGAASAARIGRYGAFGQQVVALAGLTGVGIIGVASHNLALAIAAYFVANLASGVIEPVMFTWFNNQLPSEQRATLLSVESWVFSLTMIVAFPAAGWLAGVRGWSTLYVLSGGVKLALALAILLVLWQRGARRATAAA
jgi:MFS family permease